MTDHRPIATIKAELAKAEEDWSRAGRERDRLRKELNAALLGAASHPWLGKRVTRSMRTFSRDKLRTERGTVVAYDPAKHRGLRGLYTFKLSPGDAFVLNDSGRTGYNLEMSCGVEFQLVEEDGR